MPEKQHNMTNINTIYIFIFVFSILAVLRVTLKFFISLLQPEPQKMEWSSRETFLMGVFISYIITFLIQMN
jgi:hypothetical protein